MSNALVSAWIKFGRATSHAEAITQEADTFLNAHPEPTFAVRFAGEVHPGAEGMCGIYVERGYPDPPDLFPMLLGDAIHNYRCVLDHVAWQLVAAGGVTLTPGAARRVQFPIYEDETKFDNEVASRLPGVAPAAAEAIRRRLSFKNGQADATPLHTLQALSNDDKHRSIHLVTAALWGGSIGYTCTDCRSLARNDPPTFPRLKTGTLIATMRLAYEGPNPDVTVTVKPVASVFLEDGREITNLLVDMHDAVRAILKDPAIVAAAQS
jgi:hypothetical protein